MTRSTGTRGLICLGSPPMFFMASLMAAKSTTAGTPLISGSDQKQRKGRKRKTKNKREILENHTGGKERDFSFALVVSPVENGLNVGRGEFELIAVTNSALQQDTDAVRQSVCYSKGSGMIVDNHQRAAQKKETNSVILHFLKREILVLSSIDIKCLEEVPLGVLLCHNDSNKRTTKRKVSVFLHRTSNRNVQWTFSLFVGKI